MDRAELLEWSTDQVHLWAANDEPTYTAVCMMAEDMESDAAIADYLQTLIRGRQNGSGFLSSAGNGQVFGDADNVTFDDIDWAEIIDGLTGRKAKD